MKFFQLPCKTHISILQEQFRKHLFIIQWNYVYTSKFLWYFVGISQPTQDDYKNPKDQMVGQIRSQSCHHQNCQIMVYRKWLSVKNQNYQQH